MISSTVGQLMMILLKLKMIENELDRTTDRADEQEHKSQENSYPCSIFCNIVTLITENLQSIMFTFFVHSLES